MQTALTLQVTTASSLIALPPSRFGQPMQSSGVGLMLHCSAGSDLLSGASLGARSGHSPRGWSWEAFRKAQVQRGDDRLRPRTSPGRCSCPATPRRRTSGTTASRIRREAIRTPTIGRRRSELSVSDVVVETTVACASEMSKDECLGAVLGGPPNIHALAKIWFAKLCVQTDLRRRSGVDVSPIPL